MCLNERFMVNQIGNSAQFGHFTTQITFILLLNIFGLKVNNTINYWGGKGGWERGKGGKGDDLRE